MGKCNQTLLRGIFSLSLRQKHHYINRHHLRKERHNFQVYSPMVEINHPFSRHVLLIIFSHTKKRNTHIIIGDI